jgi:hypothetical protein
MQGGQAAPPVVADDAPTAAALDLGKIARMGTKDSVAPAKPLAPPLETEPGVPWFTRDTQHEIGHHVASFVVALDCLLSDGSVDHIDAMLTASERLMQVAARTRIEAARLKEATPSFVDDRLRRRS